MNRFTRILLRARLALWRSGVSELAALTAVALLLVFFLLPHTAAGLATGSVFVPLGAGLILDAQAVFSDSQALTVTVASSNVVDLSKVRNIGIGEALVLRINLDVAASQANGNETYTAQLQTDTTAGFSAPTSVGGLITINRGDAAGTVYTAVLPPDTSQKQFLRVLYTLGGTSPNVTLTAEIIPLRFLGVSPVPLFASGFLIDS